MTERIPETVVEGAGAQEPWSAVEGARAAAQRLTKQAGALVRGMANLVASPDARSEQICAAARNAIFWDLAVPRNRVSVHCDQDWLTLTGAVDRAYQRSAAEADALRTPGVRGVTNAIIVRAQDTGSAQDASSAPAIDAA
jgi:osmotically-inducible protein OsmY